MCACVRARARACVCVCVCVCVSECICVTHKCIHTYVNTSVYSYHIAGKVGGEFTLADWRFLCPPPKYNPPNISLKKPNILHCMCSHRISLKKQGVTC